MTRTLIAFLLVQAATAGVMDFSSSATWSYTNTAGSNGPDSATSTGSTNVTMNFDLSSLPSGSLVTEALLTIIPSTTASFGGSAEFLCTPPLSPLTFFGEASGCTDLSGALFMDTYIVDGTPPGTMSSLIAFPPIFIDPAVINPGGGYSVPIFSQASMEFAEWDDPIFDGQTPAIPSFSISGGATGTLEVDFSPAPEPSSATLLLLSGLGGSAAWLIRRRRHERH